MLGSLGEERIDGNVIVTFFAIDEGAVGQQPLGRSNFRLHGSDPGSRISTPASSHSPSRSMAVIGEPLFEDVGS
eukprot:10404912-Heterocapsa_arctica.AAC.1